jgi:hypothetical protein
MSGVPSDPRDDERRVVRSNGTDEVLGRAVNLLIPRGGYPDELIELRHGARVVWAEPVTSPKCGRPDAATAIQNLPMP